jgi:hypothetical protein
MFVPSCNVELAPYADNTAVLATSRKPALLVSYLESFLSDFEWWLREWRISINVSKSTAMHFTRRCIHKPRSILLFGEPIQWVDAARYLGVILDTRLTWSSHRPGQEESCPEPGSAGMSRVQEEWSVYTKWCPA